MCYNISINSLKYKIVFFISGNRYKERCLNVKKNSLHNVSIDSVY
nr:MAG TPA: hypothetical protein [Microviridae sp.]